MEEFGEKSASNQQLRSSEEKRRDEQLINTEPIEELDAVAEDEFLNEDLGLHLFSARSEHYKAGMHPEAVCAETVHHTSVIPDYPISSEKGFA
ncbi:hypothetical protein E4U39_005312, partial [Claviceps sp. Clav50 group G5]